MSSSPDRELLEENISEIAVNSNNASIETSDSSDCLDSKTKLPPVSEKVRNRKTDTPSSESGDAQPDDVVTKRDDGFYIQRRYIINFLLFMGMLLVYGMRTNIGVIVITILDERAREKVGTLEAGYNLPHVDWDTRMIGFLHSIFYIGLFVTQIPGGYLATKVPCHRLFGACILLSATLNLLLPLSIELTLYSFTCTVRLIQGLSEGLLYPSCYGLLRHWSTPQERGRLVSSVLTGAYAGAILGFPTGGLVTHYMGWRYTFCVSGGVCILWYMFWVFLAFEKPSHHPSINESELQFLDNAQGDDVIEYQNEDIPWRKILTSLPVISVCICFFARYWTFILLLTNEPLYLSLFGISIAETGLFSSLPHILKVAFSFLGGCMADYLLTDGHLSITLVRKTMTGIGFCIQAICFFILSWCEFLSVVLFFLSLGVGFFGLTVSGWQINPYDLSTRHASIMVAIASTFGSLGAIAAPLVTGELTINQDLDGWKNVFYITGGIVIFAAVFFMIFGSGEQQPWAQPPKHVNLVQKVDPLISKPYKTYQLSRASSMETSSEKENIETGVSDKHRNSRAAVLANELIEGLNRATVK
ncbi:hypothetical protein ScPMuIL_015102 [Solemya velum]